MPVACQSRGVTEPQRDRWHGGAVTDEVEEYHMAWYNLIRLAGSAPSPEGKVTLRGIPPVLTGASVYDIICAVVGTGGSDTAKRIPFHGAMESKGVPKKQ